MVTFGNNRKKDLLSLFNTFRRAISLDMSEIGKTNCVKMNIQLTTSNPLVCNPYRLPESHRTKLNKMITELLTNKIIRESTSPYSSPIILVPKSNGELRLCVDYRKLNSFTIKESFRLPLIDDQIDKLANFEFYTTLD